MIITRDKLKRKAIITKLESDWENYKRARNEKKHSIKTCQKRVLHQ